MIQDKNAVPASNSLIYHEDLSTLRCAYMPDYDIIICQNLCDGELCQQGLTLQRLFAHCYGEATTSHKVKGCKRPSAGYTFEQRCLAARLLYKFPNIVATDVELRQLRIREDQYGPIKHIGKPCDGYACTRCEYATRAIKKVSSHATEHWRVHDASFSGNTLHETDPTAPSGFRPCKVQTFNSTNPQLIYWLVVPPPTLQIV